ncbi:MAG: PAS domain-containing protein [Caulobacteraceae bacterium]|nr:PAS domain-containing protein [Caulobacter sp.]
MTGVLDALGVSAVLIDREARIIGCCARFAELVGRPPAELMGEDGWSLVPSEDQRAARYLLEDVWRSGETVTLVVRVVRPDGEAQIVESHVQPLFGRNEGTALCQVRRINQLEGDAPPFPADGMARAANYVVDMSKQMARIGRRAMLPVTSDLLLAAAATGEQEGGLDHVEETAA